MNTSFLKDYKKHDLAPITKGILEKPPPSRIMSFRRLSKKKIRCLVINPGSLANELLHDEKITSGYIFAFKNLRTDSINKDVDFKKNSIILIDHTTENQLNPQDLGILNEYKLEGGQVYSLISFYESVTGKLPLIHLKKDWILNDDLFFIHTRWHLFKFKRAMDLCISIFTLPITLPLGLLGMLLVLLTSKGPVFFKQIRVGRNNKPFVIYKIRTMVYNRMGYSEFTVKNDQRIFPIGRFLRKTKIDELPQILNVIKGEMSLIGPRPEKIEIVEKLTRENPYYSLRHTILPGITGWAQVNQPTATPEQNWEKLEYDLYYLKNMSYFLEFRIIWRTIKIIFTMNSL